MKEDKIDIVMWTKNGESFLPITMRRIEEVFPSENISNKIMIDDRSTDETVKIGKSYNWAVYKNPKGGISSGANEALRRVRAKKFASVEQDLVIAKDWWEKIPILLEGKKVLVASGIRIPDKPNSLKLMAEYPNERYFEQTKKHANFLYGKTLDNTIYQTDLLKHIGGFPRLSINAGIDTALVKRVYDNGFLWKVDFNVKSTHLRHGLFNELLHAYWYGRDSVELSKELNEEPVLASMFLRTVFSPFRGLQIAYSKKCRDIGIIYPLIRFSTFLGVLNAHSRQYSRKETAC